MRTGCAVAALVALVAAGCSADDGDGQARPAPTTSRGTTTTSSPTSSAPADGPFDCPAVSTAQQALNDAGTAALERLGIDRGDPRAFSVTVLVASQEAHEFWQAVRGAARGPLEEQQQADLDVVTGYWAGLDEALDAIEVADDSQAAVRAAASDLAAVTADATDEALAPAQQRLQDTLASTCGLGPGTP